MGAHVLAHHDSLQRYLCLWTGCLRSQGGLQMISTWVQGAPDMPRWNVTAGDHAGKTLRIGCASGQMWTAGIRFSACSASQCSVCSPANSGCEELRGMPIASQESFSRLPKLHSLPEGTSLCHHHLNHPASFCALLCTYSKRDSSTLHKTL